MPITADSRSDIEVRQVGINHFAAAGSVPVEFHMKPHLLRGQRHRRVVRDLLMMTHLPTLVGPIRAMPDLLREDDEALGVPVGVTFTTGGDDALVVPAGSPDTGCGYRCLVARGAGISRPRDLDAQRVLSAIQSLDRLWASLRERFDICRVLTEGAPYITSLGMGPADDLARIERGGRVPGADPGVFNTELVELARSELGLHGHNGHFVEVLTVDQLLGGDALSQLDLRPGDLILVLHTGSEVFGLNVFLRYYKRMAETYAELPDAAEDRLFYRGVFDLPHHSDLGQEYLAAARCLMNYAYARRQLIGHLLAEVLNEVLGLGGEPGGFRLLSDLSHVGMEWESDGQGRKLRHRRGIQRLDPEKNLPAVICGEVGIPSFLVGRGSAAATSEFLINHGMGRNHLHRKLAAHEQECLSFSEGVVCNTPAAVYRGSHRARLAIQNIYDAVDSLAEASIVQPLARLRPLVTVKGAPKLQRSSLALALSK